MFLGEYRHNLDAKNRLFNMNKMVISDGKPCFETKPYKGKANVESNARNVAKSDLNDGLVNKFNTGVTPVSNGMEFTSAAMQEKGIRGFAFMGEVVGPDGKTVQKPMAAFVGKEIMNSTTDSNGNQTLTPTGAHEAVDQKVFSSGGFYGVDPNGPKDNQMDKTAYIPFGSNGEFHTAENGVMVAELDDAVSYSFRGSVDKETGKYGDADHYVAHFGMDGQGDFQITHLDAPATLDDIRFEVDDHMSRIHAAQYHTEVTKNDEGKIVDIQSISIADALYNIEKELIRQNDIPIDVEPEIFDFSEYPVEVAPQFEEPDSVNVESGEHHEP